MPEWIATTERLPDERVRNSRDFRSKPYVLICDSRNRMSVAYPLEYSSGQVTWVSAKPVGNEITHWMPLPEPPQRGGEA